VSPPTGKICSAKNLKCALLNCFEKHTVLSVQSSILSFLQVRKSESKLVSRLFIFEFFQGAALAIVFTTAITLFLQQLPIQDFPKVFVLSAFLLWIAAYIYHRLEHIFSAAKLVLVVLLFNMASILFFILMMNQETQSWFLFAFLTTFNILYLLNNLEFWGLASLLFDVRQSKRLFSVVSASDLPAKLCGYLLTALLVPVIGTENLLWVALGSMVISLLLYKPLVNVKEIKGIEHAEHEHTAHPVKNLQATVINNKLIRILALISFFSLCCLIVVNVILYGYIKHEFKGDKEMQSFFAIFLATVRLITLVIKAGVTNRLADKLGLQKSLLITPLILLIICFTDLFFSMRTGYERSALYVFGIMALFTDVLRMAIQSPVLLAAMQPLPTHQRLRGHTILKGLMDPFAFLAMGSLMWFMSSEGRELNLEVLGLVLSGLIICWIISVLFVDKQYAAVLTTAIRDRTLNEKFISITDKESLDILLDRIKTGNQTEAIGVLKLVTAQTNKLHDFFEAAFTHPSLTVKKYALTLLPSTQDDAMLERLKKMAADPAYNDVLPDILHTISNIHPAEDLSAFIHHSILPAAAEAVTITLRQPAGNSKEALHKIETLLTSSTPKEKITGLQLSGTSGNERFLNNIITLMRDDNAGVRKAALNAAAVHGHNTLATYLLNEFVQTGNYKDAIQAISSGNEQTLAAVKTYLFKENCEGVKSTKLIEALARSENPVSFAILEACVTAFPSKIKTLLPAILHKNTKITDRPVYQKILNDQLTAAAHILYSLHYFNTKKTGDVAMLSALHTELNDIKEQCLGLFSLLYDAGKIKKVREGLRLNTKESTANALELIHINIPEVYAEKFIHAFEPASIHEKYLSLHRTIKAPAFSEDVIIKNILFDVDYSYNAWTKACVLYSLKDKALPFSKTFVQPFTLAENAVLREMATVVIAKN
jgi:ATP:ADP antiporter, AAA family